MISSIGHSQLINHNFLCNPSPNQRSFHLDNSPRDSKNLLPDQKSLPPQEKSLKLPFPHFPLEIPKISKLFYRAPNQILHKRWISQRMSSRNSVGSQDTTLPSLHKSKDPRRSSVSDRSDTEGAQDLPKRWEFTHKVCWSKRKASGLPLVIIVFEGVIGDFYRKHWWENRGSDMSLCSGWNKGINDIYQKAFVAVVSSSADDKVEFIVKLFMHYHVKFDGIYKRTGVQPGYLQDYSQIFSDFSVKDALVVSSLSLDIEEIQSRECWGLFYEPSLSEAKRIVARMCPVHRFGEVKPSVVLVPNPRGQEGEVGLCFGEISRFVLRMVMKKQCFHELGEEIGRGQTEVKAFKLGFREFGIESEEKMQVFVIVGKECERVSYVRYHLNNLKTQIEIGKLQY